METRERESEQAEVKVSQKTPWVFYIPSYTSASGGIAYCHFLADQLSLLGEEVYVMPYGFFFREELGNFSYKIYSQEQEEKLKDSIVFYPEVIPGNPLEKFGVKKVVRGLLYKDGGLSGDKISRSENEFVFTYSRLYDDKAFLLHYPLFDEKLFNLRDSLPQHKRNLVLCYNGKNPDYKIPEGVKPPLVMLTRSWPERERLAQFLKEALIIYSSDAVTALNFEALLCGCVPIITDYQDYSLEELLEKSEINELFQLQKDRDWSEQNVLAKRSSALQKLWNFKDNFRNVLQEFVKKVYTHFGETYEK